MSELGQKFKTEREKRGISIQEVGLSLKINPRVIAAIENGERETLPARTFLRGFIKSYAQFLRLDTKEIMDIFMREYGGETLVPSPTPAEAGGATPSTTTSATPDSLPQPRSLSDSPGIAKENLSEEPRFPVGKVLLGILLFGAVILLAKLVDKYQRERVLPESTTVSGPNTTTDVVEDSADSSDVPVVLTSGTLGEAAKEVTSTPVMGASPSPHSTSTPAIAHTPSPLPSPVPKSSPAITPTSTPKPSPSPTGSPTPTPAPKPTPSPTSTPTPKPSPSPTATPTPKPTPTAATEGILTRPLEVMVETNKSVRLRYDLGDGKWTTLDMASGQIHTFRSKSPISLDVSDGGALNVIVNGRDRGKPGPAGQPVQLRLRE